MQISALAICLIVEGGPFKSTPPVVFGRPQGDVNEQTTFRKSFMNTQVNPGTDFYEYAVGNWVKEARIPDIYPSWGTFLQLTDENYNALRKILETAEKHSKSPKGSVEQQIGDFYYSGMDTSKIERLGYEPIVPELEKIKSIKTRSDFYKVLADIHLAYSNAVFAFFAGPDNKNSSMNIAQLHQAGLGLPDRDYYLKDDPRSKEIREKYLPFIARMFRLAGTDSANAEKNASTVMAIETRLAKASMDRVERRDPKKTYNKMTLRKLVTLAPNFDWNEYFQYMGVSKPGDINVAQPKFFEEVSAMMKDVPLKDWKVYLEWNVIRHSAPYLSKPFEEENFSFYGKVLYGLKAMQPRWKRVLGTINGSLGMALGKLYVKEYFPPEAKKRALKIVLSLQNALKNRIENLDWMGESTKREALKKLAAIQIKIGYPDKWRDYRKLKIDRDSYFNNVQRASIFNSKFELSKIGKRVDRTEWEMTPQTVNAYYDPSKNEIVFPAAILQPPFFDPKADDATNYGAMGAVIGHEMTHGFDDQGRQFDARGNMRDWWTKSDEEKFNERAEKIVNQFNAYVPIDSLHINGKLTEGENIADLGGLNVALDAFKKTKEYVEGKEIDGFTPLQRFFLSWANVWKDKQRKESAMLRLQTDPHSPARYRVNGPLSNIPDFWFAFGVKPGDPMRRPDSELVKIW
jgi:putative endopeptidase